jgi:Tol biopolymer transport system component
VATTGGTFGTGGIVATGGTIGTGGTIATGGTTACVLGPFRAPEALTGLGQNSADLYNPSLSADGTTLYFSVEPAFGDADIYVATRSDRGTAFQTPTALSAIDTSSDEGSPVVSNDGLTLYFHSTRFGGYGGRDLWLATRSSPQGTFGNATLLGGVNGNADDNLPWLSKDELVIVFSSTRSGESDLYTAKRTRRSDDFGTPTQLGGVNGVMSREDRAALSNDGLVLYFASDRAGGQGDKDLWTATRASPQGDFAGITNLPVLNTNQRDIDVALSADVRELVFSSNRGGRFQLYRSLRDCQ